MANLIHEVTYYKDTNQIREKYTTNESGQIHGKYVNYYENGQIQSQLRFCHGELKGVSRFFDEEGYTTQVATFKSGKLTGKMLIYQNENPISLLNYKNDKLDGLGIMFTNRKVQAIINYKDGKLDGFSQYFDKSQNKIREEYYSKGKLHGEVLTFATNGLLVSKQIFENGNQIE
jgi:antitoxin component YwqK of YwqJK toxin-antitoxin module